MSRFLPLIAAAAASVLWLSPVPASAQTPAADYPNKPVKVIVTVPVEASVVTARPERGATSPARVSTASGLVGSAPGRSLSSGWIRMGRPT